MLLMVAGNHVMTYSASPDPPPPYGIQCGVCQDVLKTWNVRFPCVASVDPAVDQDDTTTTAANCGFHCGMLCHEELQGSCPRQQICEKAVAAVEKKKELYAYIWQAMSCPDIDVFEACWRMPGDLKEALGAGCQDPTGAGNLDYLMLKSDECKHNPLCDECTEPVTVCQQLDERGMQGSSVDDSCMVCKWVFETTPLFAEACEPPKGVAYGVLTVRAEISSASRKRTK